MGTDKKGTNMFGYKVEIEREEEYYKESTEDYGPWEARYRHDFKGIRPQTEYPDLKTPFELDPDKPMYVVWVEWSSGNSFGWGERSNAEAIGLFQDVDSAVALARAAEKCGESGLDITTPDGQEFKTKYVPWIGYFDKLDEVHLEIVRNGFYYDYGFN